jgi:hypothetical protein
MARSDKHIRLPSSNADLLAHYVAILDELRDRGLTRSNNIPTGDYAEHLVARHFGVSLENNSRKGYDLRLNDPDRTRVQVKARRVNRKGRRGPSGPIRDLRDCRYEDRQFDLLVVVVFEYDYSIRETWQLPWEVVKKYAGWSERLGAARMGRIAGVICDEPGVDRIDLVPR